ncbi:tryptophan synthase subunit alpha [Sandaracinobacter sp. RS1-74]|uniref:tryptophan synthase subunit alpha n=1 Tax=Sandaracinobacteroides sayramensis TaxID=2913411 RepID=UPI001EDC04BD|nr:tryptophan synthase subunit alpha [Sandaracinobacteroides sayramensis]
MTDRIASRFAAIRGRAGLVTFISGGDPTPDLAVPILHALVRGGADLIEIGMPFTDPMADGPAIQAGNIRALGAGMSVRKLLAIVREFRATDEATPLVMMGYLNPVLAYGPGFAADASAAGLDGVILVDLPPEERQELSLEGLHLIRLATPTTDAARLPTVLDGASGFLYYVAVAGVTGQQSAAAADVAAAVRRLKAATDLPVAVGFGVKTPEQAEAIAAHADAVVVGSAIVERIGAAHDRQSNDIPGEVEAFVSTLSRAVRGARKETAA